MSAEPQIGSPTQQQTPPAPPAERRGRSYARLSYPHPQRGTAYKDILRHTTLIGSSIDCPIRLLSSEIASAHCVITLDNDVIRVRTLRPDAGIRVNGHASDISVLCHGDVLEIGPFSFRVETNLTFELSKTAPIAETRMDLVQTMGPDTATANETAPTNDTSPEPTAAPPADTDPEEPTEKPLTLEFL